MYICIYIYIYIYIYIKTYIYINTLAPSFECFIIGLQILVKEISSTHIPRLLRPNRDLLRKCNFGFPAGNRPRESSAMLCQLNYGGRCREHGHEFVIYEVGTPIK